MLAEFVAAYWSVSYTYHRGVEITYFHVGFEQASQPTLTDVQRRNLLNFCIVGMSFTDNSTAVLMCGIIGGGPTGVEFAAELHDLLQTDVHKHYPHIARLAKITIYDVAETILSSFDKSLVKWVPVPHFFSELFH